METVLSKGFCNLMQEELLEIEGGERYDRSYNHELFILAFPDS